MEEGFPVRCDGWKKNLAFIGSLEYIKKERICLKTGLYGLGPQI